MKKPVRPKRPKKPMLKEKNDPVIEEVYEDETLVSFPTVLIIVAVVFIVLLSALYFTKFH